MLVAFWLLSFVVKLAIDVVVENRFFLRLTCTAFLTSMVSIPLVLITYLTYCYFQDPQLMDKKGVVRTVSGNTCTVYLYDEKRDVSVSINNVDPGEPVKQDKVCYYTSYNLYVYNSYCSVYCCPNTALIVMFVGVLLCHILFLSGESDLWR